MSKSKTTYGGQAVLEGVMIRGARNVTVSVRTPSGQIRTRKKPIHNAFTGQFRRMPLIRGVLALSETLYLGMDSLAYSATIATEEEEEEEPSKWSIGSMIAFSVAIAIGLFFLLPVIASKPFEGIGESHLISNVAEGLIRLTIFFIYIVSIGFMSDIRRVYMYHGAEHMTVHAKEMGDPLIPSAIRNYPTAHPRCGTAFLLTVMVVAILIFSLIPRDPLWWLITSRIIFLPVIASISYEIIRASGQYADNIAVRLITAPSIWLQGLTTKQPDDSQIEVAIAAMTGAIEADTESAPLKP
tara:strand:- start:109 stop:1002 length:894 start_codon:yes stop_codon:yes gene_type:complete